MINEDDNDDLYQEDIEIDDIDTSANISAKCFIKGLLINCAVLA